jgi:hypothetical protein
VGESAGDDGDESDEGRIFVDNLDFRVEEHGD